MKRPITLLTVSMLILLIVSCKENKHISALLKKAETLMLSHPDSSLLLLQQVDSMGRLSEKQQADWCLLITQARDKNYIDHTSDSLIRIAVAYYEEKKDSERLLLAYYMMGRVSQELNMAPRAQEYYLKAMEIGKDSKDYALMARLCNNLGMLYTRQRVYDEALLYLKSGLDYLQKAGETASQAFVIRDIGRTYHQLNQLDSATYYYQKALTTASPESKSSVLFEMASVLADKKDYKSALSYSYKSLHTIQNPSDYDQTYYILGKVYLAMNQMDSASIYLHKSMNSSVLETKAGSYHQLYHLAKAKNDMPTFVSLQGEYELLRDSIEKRKDNEATLRVQSLYDYQQIASEAESIKLLHIASHRNIYRLSFLLCLTLLSMIGFIILYKKYQKNKEKQLEQKLMAQVQNHKLSMAEKEHAIKQLEAMYVEKTTTSNNIIAVNELQITELKKAKNRLLGVKETYGLSIPFHEDLLEGKKLSDEEWVILITGIDMKYPNFTQRLKIACPQITKHNLKICCLVKIGIHTNAIATILSLSNSGVFKAMGRIHVKLVGKSEGNENLPTYLSNF